MFNNHAVIALCAHHEQAESAIGELIRMGFEPKNISFFGKARVNEEDTVGFCTAGNRLVARGATFAFWQLWWDRLGDGGLFLVPGIGPVMFAGPFIREFVAAVDDSVHVDGFSKLGAAIYRLGVPKENILRYEIELGTNEIALIALGTRELIAGAKTVLWTVGASEITTGNRCLPEVADTVLQMV